MDNLSNLKIGTTVFLCGAVLMALEIAGARLLTPSYGDTVYIWGSIIGIFLLSLSFGYYLGGKLADRKPHSEVLSVIILVTGIFIFLIPFAYEKVIASTEGLPQTISPLISATVLFFIPSLLLGTVSPFVMKLKAKNLNSIGTVSGNLYALATLGSVLGTFLATFVLVIFLPIKTVFFALGATCLLVSIIFYRVIILSKKTLSYALIILVLAALFFGNGGFSLMGMAVEGLHPGQAEDKFSVNASKMGQLYNSTALNVEVESLYGKIAVRDDVNIGIRNMFINDGPMSALNLKNSSNTAVGWKYFDCMEIPFIFNPNIKKVLALGIGGGVYQKRLHDRYGVSVDNVDINEKVIELAEKYFNMTPSDSFRIYNDDARVFLKESDRRYDYITIDVFHHDPAKGYKIPFHLSTKEFFTIAKNHLTPDGIVAMNVVTESGSMFLQSEYKTLQSVFRHVYLFNCGTSVLMATDSNVNIRELKNAENNKLLNCASNMTLTDSALVLTDEYAPLNPFAELGTGDLDSPSK